MGRKSTDSLVSYYEDNETQIQAHNTVKVDLSIIVFWKKFWAILQNVKRVMRHLPPFWRPIIEMSFGDKVVPPVKLCFSNS